MDKSGTTTRTLLQDVSGILLLAWAILLGLAMFTYTPMDISVFQNPPNTPASNLIGPFGAWNSFVVFMLFGVIGYTVPIMAAALGLLMMFKHDRRLPARIGWFLLLLCGLVTMSEILSDLWAPVTDRLNIGTTGGILGSLLGRRLLIMYLGSAGAGIVAVSFILLSLYFLFDIHPANMGQNMGTFMDVIRGRMEYFKLARERARLEKLSKQEEKVRQKLEQVQSAKPLSRLSRKKKEILSPLHGDTNPLPDIVDAAAPIVSPLPEKPEKTIAAESDLFADNTDDFEPEELTPDSIEIGNKQHSAPAPARPRQVPAKSSPFTMPPNKLLEPLPSAKDRVVEIDIEGMSIKLEASLSEFGIDAKVTNVETGPVVTSFEVLPAPGVRVNKIVQLSNDIALTMKAISIRVQAPIPGKGVVGIEIPNPKSTPVFFREIIESPTWKHSKAALPLSLGKDVTGSDVVADLAKMPHMLIAGATGSGKSVCMNSLLAGLLMSRSPEEMRLMLVDPKMVEFAFFNELPHLVVPVITDPKKVAFGLRWAIMEMERRYQMLSDVGVRNIETFNERPIAKQEVMFDDDVKKSPADDIPDRLPYIVIVIDELADLMMVAQKDVEESIARLAQLSRAVGIHMIIATQRPSVNVITGTIKANFPARIAFQVAQKVDSRTILDTMGADKLLGKGDMLFLPPGTSRLMRVQGTLTTDNEIRNIVDYWKNQAPASYELDLNGADSGMLPGKGGGPVEEDLSEDPELIDHAVEVIRATKRASTSSLQRRLRIGYTRAARLMDILEDRGVVGPHNGSDPRDILIDTSDLDDY